MSQRRSMNVTIYQEEIDEGHWIEIYAVIEWSDGEEETVEIPDDITTPEQLHTFVRQYVWAE